jgi:hypothetical protein
MTRHNAVCVTIVAIMLSVMLPVSTTAQEENNEKAASETALEARKWFPVREKNSWEYEITGASTRIGQETDKEGRLIERMELVKSFGNEWHFKHSGNLAFGGSIEEQAIGVSGDFITRTNLEKKSRIWKALKLPPKKGDTWTSNLGPAGIIEEIKVKHVTDGFEDIKTPAGEFKGAVRVSSSYQYPRLGEVKEVSWYAPGVGLVKEQKQYLKKEVVITLVRYNVRGIFGIISEIAPESEYIVIGHKGKKDDGKETEKDENLKRIRGELTKNRVDIDELLKGKPDQMTITVTAKQSLPGYGKLVLFLEKPKNGAYPLLYSYPNPSEAIIETLKKRLKTVKPATKDELLAQSDMVVEGNPVAFEKRGNVEYYVFELEKTLKGDSSRKNIDVLADWEFDFIKGRTYKLFLKTRKEGERRYYSVVHADSNTVGKK